MHRDDEDSIGSLVVAIEQEHPRPRPQHKSSGCPPPAQFRARERERFKNPQRAGNPAPGVAGKVERGDRLIHIPLRSRADDYLRHSRQLVERNAFPAHRLGESLLSALPSAWNCVEDLRDAFGIGIRIVECRREERPSESPLLHVSPLGELRELAGVSLVQRDVYALWIRGQGSKNCTDLHVPCALALDLILLGLGAADLEAVLPGQHRRFVRFRVGLFGDRLSPSVFVLFQRRAVGKARFE